MWAFSTELELDMALIWRRGLGLAIQLKAIFQIHWHRSTLGPTFKLALHNCAFAIAILASKRRGVGSALYLSGRGWTGHINPKTPFTEVINVPLRRHLVVKGGGLSLRQVTPQVGKRQVS